MAATRQHAPRWIASARLGCALLFVGSGTLHFVIPRSFERIVPESLPNPELLVALSGVAEIAGGVALLVPRLRRPAAVGLVALLVAVFPANVNMAIRHEALAPGVPAWLLWGRLPLQPLLMWLVLRVGWRRSVPEDTYGREAAH